jgi:hypothetical protein
MGVFHAPYPNAHPKEGGQYAFRSFDSTARLRFTLYFDTYEDAMNAYLAWWQIMLAAARFRARGIA